MNADPIIESTPGLPRDDEGPVFREPWEAQAFAMTVRLHEAGHFTWREWADLLAEEIAAAQRAGDPDRGDTYYRHWLNALERMVLAKGLISADALRDTLATLTAPQDDHHDHDH